MIVSTNNNNNNKKTGSEKQFPGKLHDMMSFVGANALESVISWELNGFGLKINNPDKLVGILPLFFGQTKYRSFRRQLNMWHFHRILDGPYKGVFIHPYFVRHDVSLCCQMSRHLPFKPSIQKEQEYITLVSSCCIVEQQQQQQQPSSTTTIEQVSSSSLSTSCNTKMDPFRLEKQSSDDDLCCIPQQMTSSGNNLLKSFSTKKSFLTSSPQLDLTRGSSSIHTTTKDLDITLQELDDVIESADDWSLINELSEGGTINDSNSLGWFEGGDFFSLEDVFP